MDSVVVRLQRYTMAEVMVAEEIHAIQCDANVRCGDEFLKRNRRRTLIACANKRCQLIYGFIIEITPLPVAQVSSRDSLAKADVLVL